MCTRVLWNTNDIAVLFRRTMDWLETQPRESAAIRLWARKHGYEVASRGRIPTDIVDAVRAAG
jgi:penicillin V acylase-like amidase (Ntn superfamily)